MLTLQRADEGSQGSLTRKMEKPYCPYDTTTVQFNKSPWSCYQVCARPTLGPGLTGTGQHDPVPVELLCEPHPKAHTKQLGSPSADGWMTTLRSTRAREHYSTSKEK